MNVFPFEEKPNEAVSDFYTLCSGGGGQEQTSLPSTNAVDKAAGKHVNKIAALGQDADKYIKIADQTAFSEPTKNTPDVDLTQSGGVEVDYLSTSLSQEQREDIMNDSNINIG